MAFILASGEYRARLELARQRGDAPWPAMRWWEGPGGFLIGHDGLSAVNAEPSPDRAEPEWRVLFDGYLSNTGEIIDLLKLPAGAATRPPADLVHDLLRQRGPSALHRLSGCFVLAAIDSRGHVSALRDRLGGRTIYHPRQEDKRGILLATRSAWVQRLCGQPFEPDPAFMASHFGLQTGPPPGHSAFAAVRELIPGEALSWSDGRLRLNRPTMDLSPDFDYRNPGDCVARFGELLEQAVATTLPPSGDVACMLSGGLDSGPVAALADRQLSIEGRCLRAISWTLDRFPEADERTWIEMASSRLKLPTEFFDGSADLPFSRFDTAMMGLEIPAFNAFRPLVLGCYQRAATHGCRVILNGNAGDDLYPPYRLLTIDRLRRRHWQPLWRDLTRTWRIAGLRGLIRDQALREPLSKLLRGARTPPAWLSEQLREHWQPVSVFPPEANQHPDPDFARQLLGTRMSFGRAHECEFPNRFGVDRRDPFHNEDLCRFMLNAPYSLSYRRGHSKWIMRAATREILPVSLRGKARTGLLDEFFRAGLNQNRAALEQLLLRPERNWRRYLKDDRLLLALSGGSKNSPEMLVPASVGYSLWEDTWQG